ncbi:MAG: carbon-nitrogen hydrolase family protein [Burkholderiaceae bacterium]|nr:MAG: carbon-nitrogen hydrolase family protein [Burkholderiaceae bacterium]
MSAPAFRVAAVQMTSTPEIARNLDTAARLIAQAAAQGAQLVALPEYFCLMGWKDEDKVKQREAEGSGVVQEFLARTAKQHGLWLVGGTLPLVAPETDKVKNSVLVFNPQGERVARYDKIHLFNFKKGEESYDEARTISSGADVITFDAPCGRVGLSVCYDLRFPELYRAMGAVSLILVPAAFTATTGRAHWEVLLRARAIENQCYVLAPAQSGHHPNGRHTYGHSMLIDPWGVVTQVLAEGEGVVVGDIDPQLLSTVRSNLPALRHRVIR